MRALRMSAALLALAGIALALIAAPHARAQQTPPAQPAPGTVRQGGELHFRGGRGGPVKFQFDGVDAQERVFLGPYLIDGDPAQRLTVPRREEHQVWLQLRGEWEGAGMLKDTTYLGVFVYGANATDKRLRGLRGTHTGTIDKHGAVQVHVAFTDNARPGYDETWVPSESMLRTLEALRPGAQRRWISSDSLSKIPIEPNDQFVHPIWPPGSDRPK